MLIRTSMCTDRQTALLLRYQDLMDHARARSSDDPFYVRRHLLTSNCNGPQRTCAVRACSAWGYGGAEECEVQGGILYGFMVKGNVRLQVKPYRVQE